MKRLPRAAWPLRGVAVALLGTLLTGIGMRWMLAGGLPMPPDWLPFQNLRHAHSHLGYYGVLLPLSWLAWQRVGVTVLGPRAGWTYAAATLVSVLGFAHSGYGPAATVGSTVIAVLWIVAAWRAFRRGNPGTDARGADNPLVIVFPGTLLALACIPVIALSATRAPDRAAAAVQSFLAALLFLVVAPSALTAQDRRPRWAWIALLSGSAAALAMGLWPASLTRAGLVVHAALWFDAARGIPSLPLRVPWMLAAGGAAALGLGALPLTREVGVGAVHFLVLGALLPSLAAGVSAERVRPTWWWLHLAAALALTGPLLLRAFGAGAWTATASAVGGSLLGAWWLVALASRRFGR